MNAVGTRLEQVAQRVPLWVLPEYILAKDDPSAEAMIKVVDALCAANSISSKGDTETRGNKVKEIGEILLATPGLAEAMANYMTPAVFAEAFQRYVDCAKPELKAASERMGGSSHAYCGAVKNRFAATSGWLWKRGDAEAVLEEIYRQTLCAEHVRGLVGSSGFMSFGDALSRLRLAVLGENKVPTEFWSKKHPALHRFFDLLNRQSLAGEEVKAFEQLLDQQREVIREVFFDVTQAQQLLAMQELFGQSWPLAIAERRELYNAFPLHSAKIDEQSFKTQGRSKIEAYSQTLVSKQVAAIWRERTGTGSPDEWSRKFLLPAECILKTNDTKSLIDVISNPEGASAERLQTVNDKLGKEGVFLDVTTAGHEFLKRVLPARYQKIGFCVGELSAWLCNTIDNTPNRWLSDGRLSAAIEAFVKQGYDTHTRKKALEKIELLSASETKNLLLKLINQIPDVGLSVLE